MGSLDLVDQVKAEYNRTVPEVAITIIKDLLTPLRSNI